MKIVFLDLSTLGSVASLSKLEKSGEIICYDNTLPHQTVERLVNADIAITNKVVIDKEIIRQCHKLKLICVAATGTNNIDLEYAALQNISVKNVSSYSTESVAQSTFSILFHILNRAYYYDDYVKSGKYSQSPVFTYIGHEILELKGKTFGIIGLGNIGKRVAEIATVFGTKVIYYSTSGTNRNTRYNEVSFYNLLSTSDIISIHAPLNKNTENLIGYSQLEIMKDTAVLINMGRGGIVNEKDLAKALDDNQIKAAGLDVLVNEPVKPDNPLLNISDKNKLIITPHNAWASVESRERLIKGLINNIKSANLSEY